jgi:hypothetical protein
MKRARTALWVAVLLSVVVSAGEPGAGADMWAL